MRYALALITVLALGGCESLSGLVGGADLSLLEKAAETGGKVESATLGNAMKALPPYCKTPRVARSFMRDRANGQESAGGNKMGVWCVGDPVLTLGQ